MQLTRNKQKNSKISLQHDLSQNFIKIMGAEQ